MKNIFNRTRWLCHCTIILLLSCCCFNEVAAQCDIIYVSTTGNSLADGSEATPVDLQTALTQACTQNRKHIRLLSGTYNLTSKMVVGCNDVIIDGDWEVVLGTGRKNSNLTTTININSLLETAPYDGAAGTTVGYYIGIEAISRTGLRIQDITFHVKNGGSSGTVNGTTGNRGNSVYGFYFRNSSTWNLVRCDMNTGSASRGSDGVAGANGINGANGGTGSAADCDDDCQTNYGAGGGNGGGGGAGAPQNNDGSCRNAGQAGSNGTASTGRGGGGGGSGGSAGAENNSGRGGGAGAAGGGGAGGGGGNGGNGNGSNGSGSCSSVNATAGSNGSAGGNGTTGAVLPISNTFSNFWLPSAQSATGTDATGGGGGGAGGGGGGQGCFFCTDGTGGGGGGGGGGGQGSAGGTGGWGAGGTFALYLVNSIGARHNVNLIPGAVALGGTAGNGGVRGLGGNGGGLGGTSGGLFGCSSCEVGIGGIGGRGGDGGTGGNGGTGANGLSETTRLVSGSSVAVTTSANIAQIITNEPLEGCQNSEIIITKNGGTWGLPGSAAFIPNLTSSTSSYNTASNNAIISYNTVGSQTLSINGIPYAGFVQINTARPLPTFSPSMATVVCEGQSFTMSTPTVGAQHEWLLFEGTNNTTTPVAIFTTSVASYPTPVSGVTVNYHLRLRVRDNCCGWSTPVYFNFDVVPTSVGPTVTLDTVCAGETAFISTTGSGTLNWFSDPLGQVLITSGPAPTLNLTTPVLNQNTVFYAGQSVGSCLGPLTSAEVIVNQLPNQPSTTPVQICVGQNVILSATGSGTGDLVFYNNALVEIGRTTMSVAVPNATFNAGALAAGSYSFYVREDNGTCESPLNLIGVTVNPLPAAPTASGTTICAGNATTLTATAAGVVNWYADATMTNLLATGSTFNTPVLTLTTSYYVTQVNANNCESATTMVTVTVNANPASPTGTGATICAGQTASISATNSGGTLNWYSDAAGSNMVGTGSPFTTAILTQNTTYYVRETNGGTGCMSGFVAVTVTVNQLPTTPSSAPIMVCVGDDVILTATGSGTGDLNFYDNAMTLLAAVPMGGTPTQTYNAGALAAGGYLFYVTEDNGTCESLTAAIGATVNALPAAPTATGTTICSGASATLTATATGSVNWYSDAAMTNLVGTGSVYMTGALTANTDYYVTQVNANNCESAATMVTVTVNANPANPTGTGATICAGQTASISATNSGGTLNWYSDAAGANMVGTGSPFTTAILTQNTTYYVREINGGTGCMSAFVAVTVTVNQLPTAPNAGTPVMVCDGDDVMLSASGSGTGDLVFYNNVPTEIGRVTMGGNPSATFNAGAFAVGSYSFIVREDNGTCLSMVTALSVTVNALPAAPTAAGVTICSGASATLTATATGTVNWYSDAAMTNLVGTGSVYMTGALTANTDYYVTQVNANNCESAATMVTVTIEALPADPVGTGASICAGQTATLSAVGTGGTLSWYSDASGNVVVGTGALFTTSVLNQTTTYYVQEVSATGCESNLVAVTATVTALPGAPSVSASSVCEGQDVLLTATGSGTGDLVFYDNALTEIGRVTMGGNPTGTFNAGAMVAGNYVFYAAQDNGTCTSGLVAIGVTVNALPAAPVAAGATICAGTSATLSSTGSVNWYSDVALTNLVSVTNSFNTGNLTTTTDYYLVATATNGCSSASTMVTVTVDALPATPTVVANSVCAGSAATLTATGSGGTLNWYSDAAGLTMVGTGATLTVSVINQNTTFYVNETNATTGCTSMMGMGTVTVNPLPNPPSASDVVICSGANVVLSATGSGAGDLVFYNSNNVEIGRFTMSVGNETGTHNAGALAVGNYVFFVAEDRGNCLSNRQSVNVEVRQLPAAPTAFNDSPVCAGEMVFLQASTVVGATYSWTGPNGFSSTLQNFSLQNVTAAQAGTYNVALTLNGCTSSSTSTNVVVNARPVAAALTSNSPLCDLDNLSITTTAVAGASYAWTGPNGFTSSSQNITINNVMEADHQGFYTLVVTDANNCTSMPVSTLVMITSLPDAGLATNNSPVCIGANINLEVQEVFGASYAWSGPNGFTSTSRTPVIAAAQTDTGTYSVVVTVNNCSSTYNTYVSVHPRPTIDLMRDTFTTVNTPLNLYVSGGLSYQWTPAANLSNANIPNPVFMSSATGSFTYVVFAYNMFGCSDQDRVNITVNPADLQGLRIVDLFTPNGDGVNDYWPLDFLQDPNIGTYTLQVMTRGGMEVLNTQNYQNDWYGQLNGSNLPDGTYFYIIHLDNGDKTLKGAVTIKR